MRCIPVWLLASASLAATVSAQSGWIRRTPATSPAPRGGALLVFDFLRGTTVLFGGWPSFGDTWEWDGTNWNQRVTTHLPPPRGLSAFAFDPVRGRVVMFGGGQLNDTWEFDGNDWFGSTPPILPPARILGAMAWDPVTTRTLLFGGGTAPPLIFGDTWSWDGSTWTLLQPAHLPIPRWSHGMVTDYLNGRIVMHGGLTGYAGSPALTDTWTWSGTDWTALTTPTLPAGFAACGLSFDWAAGTIVRFGGLTPLADETWLFAHDTWARDTRAAPPARYNGPCAYDVWRNRTVMFGGSLNAQPDLGDTWEYIAPPLSAAHAFGAGCPGSAGTPALQPISGSRPVLGRTFALQLTSVTNGAPAVFAVGFSNSAWTGGPLPFALAPVGMPGCTLLVSPDRVFFTSVSGGAATTSLSVPNDLGILGLEFFAQALLGDPAANSFGAVLSNALAGVIGLL